MSGDKFFVWSQEIGVVLGSWRVSNRAKCLITAAESLCFWFYAHGSTLKEHFYFQRAPFKHLIRNPTNRGDVRMLFTNPKMFIRSCRKSRRKEKKSGHDCFVTLLGSVFTWDMIVGFLVSETKKKMSHTSHVKMILFILTFQAEGYRQDNQCKCWINKDILAWVRYYNLFPVFNFPLIAHDFTSQVSCSTFFHSFRQNAGKRGTAFRKISPLRVFKQPLEDLWLLFVLCPFITEFPRSKTSKMFSSRLTVSVFLFIFL